MTGTQVTTDKPAAFFALNQGPLIPARYDYADLLFQQLCPVNKQRKHSYLKLYQQQHRKLGWGFEERSSG